MSTNINANVLKNFIVKTIGGDKLFQHQAGKVGIDENQYVEANSDENEYLDLDEILNNNNLYEQFATMYVEEKDKDAEAVDAEQQKKEETKVKDKSESKA